MSGHVQCEGHSKVKGQSLTLLHSEWPKLRKVLALLSAIGLKPLRAFVIICSISCFLLQMSVALQWISHPYPPTYPAG